MQINKKKLNNLEANQAKGKNEHFTDVPIAN